MIYAYITRILPLLTGTAIVSLAGCNSNDAHSSADSLLEGFVAAQSNGDAEQLTSLMYKPESLETLGQSKDDMFNLLLQPGKTVAESHLINLKPTDNQRFDKQHKGMSFQLRPTPVGKLEVRFKEQGGANRIAVMYGRENGKYFISTYQRAE